MDCYFLQSVGWSILCSIPFVLLGVFVPGKVLALLGADAGTGSTWEKPISESFLWVHLFLCVIIQ